LLLHSVPSGCTDNRNRYDFYSVNEHHQSSQRIMNAGDSALRPEAARTQVLTQGHWLARYRLNDVLGTMPEFEYAFGCHAGQPMVHVMQCRAW